MLPLTQPSPRRKPGERPPCPPNRPWGGVMGKLGPGVKALTLPHPFCSPWSYGKVVDVLSVPRMSRNAAMKSDWNLRAPYQLMICEVDFKDGSTRKHVYPVSCLIPLDDNDRRVFETEHQREKIIG